MDHEAPISARDWETLAAFRRELRGFLRFSEEAARRHGLTPQQHQLLLAIKGTPGRDWLSIRELAEDLKESHHGVVGLVDRLERGGFVARAPHAQDRRTVEVRLTEAGEDVLVHLTLAHRQELRQMAEIWHALSQLGGPSTKQGS